MKTLLVLFQTDAWLTNTSKTVMGVFETKEQLIDELKNEDWTMLTDDDIHNLENINQTQDREINFLIEEIETNRCY